MCLSLCFRWKLRRLLWARLLSWSGCHETPHLLLLLLCCRGTGSPPAPPAVSLPVVHRPRVLACCSNRKCWNFCLSYWLEKHFNRCECRWTFVLFHLCGLMMTYECGGVMRAFSEAISWSVFLSFNWDILSLTEVGLWLTASDEVFFPLSQIS